MCLNGRRPQKRVITFDRNTILNDLVQPNAVRTAHVPLKCCASICGMRTVAASGLHLSCPRAVSPSRDGHLELHCVDNQKKEQVDASSWKAFSTNERGHPSHTTDLEIPPQSTLSRFACVHLAHAIVNLLTSSGVVMQKTESNHFEENETKATSAPQKSDLQSCQF